MEPAGERRDDAAQELPAGAIQEAAMEPAAERRDDPSGHCISAPVRGPQWSLPVSGGTTFIAVLNGPALTDAAIEPASGRRDDPTGLNGLSPQL